MEFTRCYGCMCEISAPGGVCPHCGYDNTKGLSEQPAHALPCGSVLAGHYLVGKVLGQGGFGITYIGWNLSLDMPVCIKEYFPAGAAMRSTSQSSCVLWGGGESAAELKQGRESFVKEARKAVKLSDLGSVVKVWDVFYENETAYIVMNYIEGETLKNWLVKRGKPLDEKSCFALLEPVMQELEEVHKRGIIHRDIKPDNLMLTPEGKLVLLDLGAAKDLSGGSGQSSYMVASQGFSPMEQYRAHGEIGPWTDVYAMCATFYYCVKGKVLPTPIDRAEGIIPDMTAFSPAVASVLAKGLALRSKDRIQSLGELSSLLQEALRFDTHVSSKVKAPTAKHDEMAKPVGSKPTPSHKKTKLPLVLLIFLFASLTVLAVTNYMGTQNPPVTVIQTEAPHNEMVPPTSVSTPTQTLKPTPTPTAKPSPKPEPILIPTPEPVPESLRIVDIAAGAFHTAALYSNGTVASTMITGGEPYYDKGQCEVSDWRNIVAVVSGGFHTVGLCTDGTVVAAGSNEYGQCDVSNWQDIVAVAAGDYHTIGLRSNGTVVATEITDKQYYDYGQSNVSNWRNVVAVFAGATYSIGIQADGSIVAAGKSWDGQGDVSEWRDIVQIVGDYRMVLGLRSNGTILALGSDYYGRFEASHWSEITAISTSGNHTVGLKANNTVIAVGRNDLGQCDVSNWSDITAISAGAFHTVGLRADGTIVAVGRNIEGQCSVDALNAPVLTAKESEPASTPVPTPTPTTPTPVPTATPISVPEPTFAPIRNNAERLVGIWSGKLRRWNSDMQTGDYLIGLLDDGTVFSVGSEGNNKLELSGWSDIVDIETGKSVIAGIRRDGTVVLAGDGAEHYDVNGWTGIKKLLIMERSGNSTSPNRIIGLRNDGNVVVSQYGGDWLNQVTTWTNIKELYTTADTVVGLRFDGAVSFIGRNDRGWGDLASWKDVEKLFVDGDHVIGILKDGTVRDTLGRMTNWTDIYTVYAARGCNLGLRSDGTVVCEQNYIGNFYEEIREVEDWRDIASLFANGSRVLGLRTDGTVVCAGNYEYGIKSEISEWTEVKDLICGSDYAIALRTDGTIMFAGADRLNQKPDLSSWKEIVGIWSNSTRDNTLGVREDGTFVLAGSLKRNTGIAYSWTIDELNIAAKAAYGS